MHNQSLPRFFQSSIELSIDNTLAEHAIEYSITRKKIKNINFRIKANQLKISAPLRATNQDINQAIHNRLTWIINANKRLLIKQSTAIGNISTTSADNNLNNRQPTFKLWGKELEGKELAEAEKLRIYRKELTVIMPTLFSKWEPIVGKTASEQRIKKMNTRWGSCNTKAKRIWLSVYLPEYPLECTEYVIVHELCHLHYANHSNDFWYEVKKAMPDYLKWHNMLKGEVTNVD